MSNETVNTQRGLMNTAVDGYRDDKNETTLNNAIDKSADFSRAMSAANNTTDRDSLFSDPSKMGEMRRREIKMRFGSKYPLKLLFNVVESRLDIDLRTLAGSVYTVNWGDGVVEEEGNHAVHTYAAPGQYTVTITGIITGFNANNFDATQNMQLIDVLQWGSSCEITHFVNMFRTCHGITSFSAPDKPIFKPNTSCANMFLSAANFNGPIGDWDVSNVVNMTWMFRNAISFNQNISMWDVSNVTVWTTFRQNSPLSSENTPPKFL